MDDGLKQRLVGAVVLSAVAVLFVPVLFDQHDKHKVDTVSQIPVQPNIDPVQYQAPTRSGDIDPAPKPERMFLPQGGDEQVVDTESGAQAEPSPQPFVATPKTKPTLEAPQVAASSPKTAIVKPKPRVVQPKIKPKAKPKSKPKSKPSDVKPKTSPEEILKADGTPNAWVLQLISSSSEVKAKKLVTQLQDDNYSAYYRSAKTPKGVIYRVYVGPKINRRKAEGLKRELDKRLKVDALILRFQP